MPRHPRIHEPNLLYHIITRGNHKQAIYQEKEDYELFLKILEDIKKKYLFNLYAYVLMPNHFHMLIEVEINPIWKIMQNLLCRYVCYYNKKYNLSGHLFQGRYKAIVCDKENYFLELIRYIHLNPVRAKMVKTPIEWEWSGHGEYTGKNKKNLVDLKLIKGILGDGETGFRNYIMLLEGCDNKEYYPSDASPFLGSDEFISRISAIKSKEFKTKSKTLEDIADEVCQKHGMNKDILKEKSRGALVASVRMEFIRKSIFEYGNRQSAIAQYLGCDPSYISRTISQVSQA